ncbi:hypothetical protein SteCoe_26103 [Stentor coeruleus]|uniref:Uncharacterized protein n=1 Tax=Stentor coeruleus TaxID=5963 RepID=A0A1R2BDT0_9CILI|nr:hypothetical protein SteCoe_26103 [Stentor coeruleus]
MIGKIDTTKLSEISELKEAVKDYKIALKHAKSLQSLKKCYQSYKNQQKIRAGKNQEKLCSKISNLIHSDLKTIDDFQFFPMLISLKQYKIPLRIPLTLYCSGKEYHLIKSESFVNVKSGPETVGKFLKDLPGISCLPICLFKPQDGKIKLFCNLSMLRNFIYDHSSDKGYYQHFVHPIGANASVLVAHAKLNSYTTSYVVKNNIEIPKKDRVLFEKQKSLISNSGCDKIISVFLQDSISKHELIPKVTRQLTFEFPTLDSSSVSHLDYPPQIKNQKFRNLIQRIQTIDHYRNTYGGTSPHFSQNLNEIYLVNLRKINLLSAYLLKATVPSIEKMTKTLYNLISEYIRKEYFREILEITLIYIKEKDKGWTFLGVDKIKCSKSPEFEEVEMNLPLKDRPSSIFIHDFSVILNASIINNADISPEKSDNDEEVIKVRQFKHLKAKSCFQTHNFDNPINLDDKITKQINNAVFNCDTMKFKARMAKFGGKTLDKKYEALKFWKEFSVKVQKGIVRGSIGRYFVGFTNEKFYSVSRYFFKVFSSDIDIRTKKKLKDVHREIMISDEDFDEMKKIYMNALEDFNIEDEDMKFIAMSFESIRYLIVSEDNY